MSCILFDSDINNAFVHYFYLLKICLYINLWGQWRTHWLITTQANLLGIVTRILSGTHYCWCRGHTKENISIIVRLPPRRKLRRVWMTSAWRYPRHWVPVVSGFELGSQLLVFLFRYQTFFRVFFLISPELPIWFPRKFIFVINLTFYFYVKLITKMNSVCWFTKIQANVSKFTPPSLKQSQFSHSENFLLKKSIYNTWYFQRYCAFPRLCHACYPMHLRLKLHKYWL